MQIGTLSSYGSLLILKIFKKYYKKVPKYKINQILLIDERVRLSNSEYSGIGHNYLNTKYEIL